MAFKNAFNTRTFCLAKNTLALSKTFLQSIPKMSLRQSLSTLNKKNKI